MSRIAVYGFSLIVVLAMLSPVLRRAPVDGFPLSTYPMFSGVRGATSRVYTVLGVTASGEREVLSPWLIGGDDPVILAANTAVRARGSRERRRALCEQVALRVAQSERHRGRYVELVFVVERYNAPAYFLGETAPERAKVLAKCPVST